jgi:membrane protein implicated in regulation of membrane protease activity
MNLELNATYWWLIAAMLLVIIEMVSPIFGALLVAGAAVIAAVFAAIGYTTTTQLCVFGAATILSLGLLRPRIMAKLYSSQGVPSRTEALIGKEGTVTETIDPSAGTGRILVLGQDWAAQSTEKIHTDSIVRVESADGIILKVKAT